eukprot:485914-Prorocentrum_minimum.AAC.2
MEPFGNPSTLIIAAAAPPPAAARAPLLGSLSGTFGHFDAATFGHARRARPVVASPSAVQSESAGTESSADFGSPPPSA